MGWFPRKAWRAGAERSGLLPRAVSAEENGTVEELTGPTQGVIPAGLVHAELHRRFSGRKEQNRRRFRAFSLVEEVAAAGRAGDSGEENEPDSATNQVQQGNES